MKLKTLFRKILNFIKENMYNNLQQFGPPDPSAAGYELNAEMSGTWIKTREEYSGPSVLHVRDAVMDGNDMIVITDQGNISMNEFANNYYKQSDEEYNLDGTKISGTSKPKLPVDVPKPKLPIDTTNNIDYNILTKGLESPIDDIIPEDNTKSIPEPEYKTLIKPANSSVDIIIKNDTTNAIDKVFSKLDKFPEVKVFLEWKDFPKAEIDMLIKYFDVSKKDIASYILEKYANGENIVKAIEQNIEDELNK